MEKSKAIIDMDEMSERAAVTTSAVGATAACAHIEDEEFHVILAAGATGEDWALARLYQAVQPSLLGYLRAREPSLGDDLASETWINVAEGMNSFAGGFSAFRSWVFTIARCRLVDHRRRTARRPVTVVDLDGLAAAGPHDDPEAQIIDVLAAREAIGRITRLPADQADVVLLRVIAGLGTHEVATIMGKSPGTVRVIQHRALRRLARDLSVSEGSFL